MVFIASMSGHIVNWPQQQCCYNASKAGVIQLGKSLAAEWAPHNIRVSKFPVISPKVAGMLVNIEKTQFLLVIWILLSTVYPLWKPRKSYGALEPP